MRSSPQQSCKLIDINEGSEVYKIHNINYQQILEIIFKFLEFIITMTNYN